MGSGCFPSSRRQKRAEGEDGWRWQLPPFVAGGRAGRRERPAGGTKGGGASQHCRAVNEWAGRPLPGPGTEPLFAARGTTLAPSLRRRRSRRPSTRGRERWEEAAAVTVTGRARPLALWLGGCVWRPGDRPCRRVEAANEISWKSNVSVAFDHYSLESLLLPSLE